MNKNTTPQKENATCKGCGIQYNRDNVARVYGVDSSVLLGGYHSAACYTNHTISEPLIDKEKALIEICGSIVPISEVEKAWKEYCNPLNERKALLDSVMQIHKRVAAFINEAELSEQDREIIGDISLSIGELFNNAKKIK